MTLRPSACDSSTRARISSRSNAPSLGPCPARELAPPVVAHLMTSAPARTMVRTMVRASSTPLATPWGSAGSGGTTHSWPDGLTRSPMPPMGATVGGRDAPAGEDPRPPDQPLLHRDPESRVEPACITHGGVAHAERALDGTRRA